MGIVMKDEGGSFTPCPAGNHIGVCYSIIDLGTQHNEKWNKDEHKICIMWELPLLRIQIEDNGTTVDKPRAISRAIIAAIIAIH